MLIACLGIFGISALVVNKRIKEVCIRKIHGASFGNIVLLLSGDYLKWVILANVIAWPAAWYYMQNWLNDFSFRIPISPAFFIIPLAASFFMVLLSVLSQIVKAVRANPVDSLKYE